MNWLGELPRRVLTVIDLGRATDEVFHPAAAEVGFKNAIGIVEVADDDIESCKIICQLDWKIGFLCEETRERPILDGANGLRIKAILRDQRDVFVSQNLNVGIRLGLAQRFDCRQGEDEIADRASPNNQNSSHPLW